MIWNQAKLRSQRAPHRKSKFRPIGDPVRCHDGAGYVPVQDRACTRCGFIVCAGHDQHRAVLSNAGVMASIYEPYLAKIERSIAEQNAHNFNEQIKRAPLWKLGRR